ncbi:Outer membrane factor (OMF) lipoprotein associated wth MdtABC efflux system [Methylorubrum populi]|uniref:Outer membrane factor (OMF) lipoprotein associated wth MdtABC efflux system n=1 Tax=Methylorubrum populi TaxID=223967 RepID=A0A833J421_9HYPH|nr:Outer membrane factor (OMF) lipoprotein associated wth MdtABC efflux system [Methylorubrum populi]
MRGGRGERRSSLAAPAAKSPEAGFPSPDPLRGPPSPAEGRGLTACAQ